MGSKSEIDIHHELKGNHVLLVDYCQTSLLKSLSVLSKASINVTQTKNQQVALTLLQTFKTQYGLLITSDQNEGNMDFHSFLQRVRLIREDIPIVVMLSTEEDIEPRLRTLFDCECHVVKKPLTEKALRCVWQQHTVKKTLAETRESLQKSIEKNAGRKGKGCASGEAEENVAQEDKGKQGQVEICVTKKSMSSDSEKEVAKKKGKCVAKPPREVKKSRPTFDDEEHKRFLEAIQYNGKSEQLSSRLNASQLTIRKGPTKPISKEHYLPSGGVTGREVVSPVTSQGVQKPPLADKKLLTKQKTRGAFSTKPRAPWSQHIYEEYVHAASHDNVPGMTGNSNGAQKAPPPQFPWPRAPPSWMTPQDWRTRKDSEFLNSRRRKFPVLESDAPPKAPTTFNGGSNPTTLEIPPTQTNQTTQGLGYGFTAQNGLESDAPPKDPSTFNSGSNPTTLEIPATQTKQTTQGLGFSFTAPHGLESDAPPKAPSTFNGGSNPTTLEIQANPTNQTTQGLGFGFTAQHGHATSFSANPSASFRTAENTASEVTQKQYVFGEDKATFGSQVTESSPEITAEFMISAAEVDQWLNLETTEDQNDVAVLDPSIQALQEPINPNTQEGYDYMEDIFAFIESYEVGTDSNLEISKEVGPGENHGEFSLESLGFNYAYLKEFLE